MMGVMVTKVCSACFEEKEIDPHFPVRRTRPDGHEGRCRSCKRAGVRVYYGKDPSRQATFNRTRRDALRERIFDYLAEHPCVDCGENDVVVLQFDHCRGTKVCCVGAAVSRGWSWPKIVVEIEKCEVRCANCHMRMTALRAGWKRLLR